MISASLVRRAAGAAFLVAGVLAPAAAHAQDQYILDFTPYESSSTMEHEAVWGAAVKGTNSFGQSLYFIESNAANSRNVLGVWGTDASDFGNVNRAIADNDNTPLFGTAPGSQVDVYAWANPALALDPQRFIPYFLDVAPAYQRAFAGSSSTAGFTVTIFGFLASNNAQFSQTFTIPALGSATATPTFTRLLLTDPRWQEGINRMAWVYSTATLNSHIQFTNVAAQVVTPEPGTVVLMLTGLGLVAGVARRRRSR